MHGILLRLCSRALARSGVTIPTMHTLLRYFAVTTGVTCGRWEG